MNKFSEKSERELSTCHPELQRLIRKVLQIVDCAVIEGHRGKEKQDEYFRTKRSKLKWPNGEHNLLPSKAFDIAPCPVDFTEDPKVTARFYYFAGVVKAVASEMGIKIRWGGDWDGDVDFSDQTFDDLVHFELVG